MKYLSYFYVIVSSLLITQGCASLHPSYERQPIRYHVLDLANGKLLNPYDPFDDKPLAECLNHEDHFLCIVMDIDEFFNNEEYIIEMEEHLKACQK